MEKVTEKIIKQFLYSELSEAERLNLEERFITDPDLFDQIKVIEDELIEKYVRGWLDPAERSNFETRFLNSNKRRERVEFSRHLISTIGENNEPAAVAVKKTGSVETGDSSVWDKISAFLFNPGFAIAGTAAVIIAVFGIWVFYQSSGGGKTELAGTDQNQNVTISPAATPQPPTEPSNESTNLKSVEPVENDQNVEANVEKPAPKPSVSPEKQDLKNKTSPVKPKEKRVSVPVPVLSLFAGTLRSAGERNVLNLPMKAKAAVFVLNLEGAEYQKFQARVVDQDGNVLFQKDDLKRNKSRVSITVPSEKLKRGDYIIKLSGKTPTDTHEPVADYQFRVKQ